jgi:hypothetical protein
MTVTVTRWTASGIFGNVNHAKADDVALPNGQEMNVSRFWNLFDARRKVAAWRIEYSSERPHSALGYLTPTEFADRAASPSAVSNIARPALPQGPRTKAFRNYESRFPPRARE